MSDFSKEELEFVKRHVETRIGENIRKYREIKGLTQTELANKILSDRQYLYKIETAKVGISVTKLYIISRALGVPMESLVRLD